MATGDPPAVDTGPPPDVNMASPQSNGSIAATGPSVEPPQPQAPRGPDGAETSTPPATDRPQIENAAPTPKTASRPPLAEVFGTPPPHTPDSFDVFADTSASAPSTPVSRRFEDDGDADMGETAISPSVPLKSSIQASLQATPSTSSAPTSERPTPSSRDSIRSLPTAVKKSNLKPKDDAPRTKGGPRTKNPRPSRASRNQQQVSKKPSVWSAKGADELRAALSGIAPSMSNSEAAGAPPDAAFARLYECAAKPANLREDGNQLPTTKLQKETLFRWTNHQLFLATPPLFLMATHTSAERDVFYDFYRDHLDFRLYAMLPIGISLSEGNSKWDFCRAALLGAAQDSVASATVDRMLSQTHWITCAPKSRIAVLRFVRPEVRDSWEGFQLKFGAGKIKLVATDSLTTDVPRIGMDSGARAMLYHVFLRGHSTLNHSAVRSIGAAAAQLPVLDVQSIESIGMGDFSGHKWKLMFNQITCPKALEQVRRLSVQYGDQTLVFDVHHPRAAQRMPCAKCLSVRHVTPNCTNTQAAEGLKRHTAIVSVEAPTSVPKLTAALSSKKLDRQLLNLRKAVAPDLLALHAQDEAEREAKAKRKIKVVADRAAEQARRQQAAKEHAVRLEQTVKEHAAQALRRKEELSAKAAMERVTKQLSVMQRRARANHVEAMATMATVSCAEIPAQGSPITARVKATEPVSAPSPAEPASVSGEVAPPSGSPLPTASAPASDDGSTTASVPCAPIPPVATDSPAPSVAATKVSLEVEPQHTVSTLTLYEPLNLTGKRPSPPSPTSSDDEGVAKWQRQEAEVDDEASKYTVSTLTLYEPLNLTGKRPSPPSPTSSDDEGVAKWQRQDAPFESTCSPIQTVAPTPPQSSPLVLSPSPEQPASPTEVTAPQPETKSQRPPSTKSVVSRQASVQDAKPLKQLPLSAFYAPQSLSDANAQLEQEIAVRQSDLIAHWVIAFPSPKLDQLLQALRSPKTLEAWCEALNVRIVITPGNGGCFYFAFYGCRTHRLRGNSMTVCPTHTTEGNWHKERIIQHLLEYLEQMLSVGTITIADMMRRYLGKAPPVDREMALEDIRNFLRGVIAANVGKHLTKAQWAGDEEMFAAVWYTRAPLFVITEAVDATTSVRVIWLERAYVGGPERIVQLTPDAGEAFEILRTFLKHRVAPSILVHTTSNGNGHFNCMRIEEELYAKWTEDDETGDAMRARMDQVLVTLGWYVAPHEDAGIPRYQPAPDPASGSVFTPPEFTLDESWTQLSADALLSPVSLYALLSALNPRRRRRGPLAQLWEQAERLNLIAYRVWDDAQFDIEVRSEADTVNSGCRFWSSRLSQLVALLRALPYPEVAMSLLPSDLLIRLGNELNDLVDDGSVPAFVQAEDPVEARRQWVTLVALVVVGSLDELHDLRSVHWLRQHPDETVAALHKIRLFDWTIVAKLAQWSDPTHPNHSSAPVPASGGRV